MVVFCWDLTAPEKGWERMGEVESGHGVPSMMVPLREKDLYLGVSYGQGFVGDQSGASLVARFRLRDERFQFEDLIEMPLDDMASIAKRTPRSTSPETPPSEPANKDDAHRPWNRAFCMIDPPSLAPSLFPPSVSADHLAICAAEAGVIWVFELAKGSLRRTYNLDGLAKGEFRKTGLLNHSILGTAFDSSGRLIVAKRDRELAQIAVKLSKETTEPVEKQMQKEDFRMFTELYTDIRWIALDPATGTRQDFDLSADFPTATPTFRKQTYLQFLVTPVGTVKTNAYRDWDSLKREFGICLTPPKAEPLEDTKKTEREPSTNPQASAKQAQSTNK